MSDPFWIERRGLYYVVTLRAGRHAFTLKRFWSEAKALKWRDTLRKLIEDDNDPYVFLERLKKLS